MNENLKALIKLHPEKSTAIYDIYEVIKEHPKALEYIEYVLNNNIDLKRAESFFIKIYGNSDKD